MTERSAETPRVESFVLRFVGDTSEVENGGSTRAWHAVILHVQTKEEKSFAHFADAVAFIARYVPVGEFLYPGESPPSGPESDGEPKPGL